LNDEREEAENDEGMTDGEGFSHLYDVVPLCIGTTGKNDFTAKTFIVPNFLKNVSST